jgi:hypothetical protein
VVGGWLFTFDGQMERFLVVGSNSMVGYEGFCVQWIRAVLFQKQ